MFGWDEAEDNHRKVQQHDQNQPELSHEVLAGGASFMAMHEWEEHQRKEGKPVSHEFAKEAIAAVAGVEVDRLAETKGADYIDREEAKHKAKKNAQDLYDQQYGNQDNFDPEQHKPHKHMKKHFPESNDW